MSGNEFQPFSGDLVDNDVPKRKPDDDVPQPIVRQLGHEAVQEGDEGQLLTPDEQKTPDDEQVKEQYEKAIRTLEEILSSDASVRSLVGEVESWRGRPVDPGKVQDVIGQLTRFLDERAQKAYDAGREFVSQSSDIETDIRRENREGSEDAARVYIKAYDELRRGIGAGISTLTNQTPDVVQIARNVANGDVNWLNRLVDMLHQQENAASVIRSAVEQAQIYIK